MINILLISDDEHARSIYSPRVEFMNSAPGYLNGYLSQFPNISLTHRYIDWEHEGFRDLLHNAPLIAYSAVSSFQIVNNLKHLMPLRDRLVIGGPGAMRGLPMLKYLGFKTCSGFGELWFEKHLGLPKTPDLWNNQRFLLTPAMHEVLSEYEKTPGTEAVFLPLQNRIGCSWNKCNFCPYDNTARQFRGQCKTPGKDYRNLRELAVSIAEQARAYLKTKLFLTSDTLTDIRGTHEALRDTLPWGSFLRPGNYAEDFFRDFKDIWMLFIGVEVVSNQGLKILNKNTNTRMIEQTLRATRKAGILNYIGMMHKIPGFDDFDNALENFKTKVLPYVDHVLLNDLDIIESSAFFNEGVRNGLQPVWNELFQTMPFMLTEEREKKDKMYEKTIRELVDRAGIGSYTEV